MTIVPTFAALQAYRAKQFCIQVSGTNNDGQLGTAMSSSSVVLDVDGAGNLRIRKATATDEMTGRWINFLPQKATFGYLYGSENWAGSGPFSGCRIEVGYDESRKYMAHIAVSDSGDARKAWIEAQQKGEVPSGSILLRGRVDKPEGRSAAYVFVSWTAAGVESVMIVLDILTAGSDRGTVREVKKIKQEDKLKDLHGILA